ncbi:uncharacterized protein [Parasteatoda tepidariorum]|uniref:uncharacterized protein n=1 Tax=Parasteatoda tepidariorum TaxID=114398 RepID=UPI001C718504|nr:uncharacterized protein LOC107444279 [Parasteatoda tepidariorum]
MSSTCLDYRDCLLIYKAFHLKENGAEGEICQCGLEKENIAFLKEHEEIAVMENRNYINSRGRYRKRFLKDTFKIESIMAPASDDDIWAAEKLKKIFCFLPPFKALVWCGRFLIKFHERNQCSQYLTSAVKFYLKSLDIGKYDLYYTNHRVDKKILELLRLSCKHRVHHSVFIEFLRLIFNEDFYDYYSYLDASSMLEDILKAAHESKIDVLNVWREVDTMSYSSFNDFIRINVVNVIPMIRCGKTECLSFSAGNFDCWYTAVYDFFSEVSIDDIFTSKTSFRCLQITYLFLYGESRMMPSITAAYILKLLWNSITDSFLCEEDFKKSGLVVEPTGAYDVNILHKAWTWYEDHVLENVNSPKRPRSLGHLSRCSVRRQLAACLQLPCGVEQLDVPKILKSYILLEDSEVIL